MESRCPSSGSEVGFFEREVVNYSATTYGRRAGQRRLRPFKPRDVELFLPGWTAEDKVAAYAVFGHMPYYLAHVREPASLADNILDLVRETRGAQLRNVDRELDAVAIADDGNVIAIGSCKWTSGSLPYSEKAKLDVLGAHLQPDGPPPQQFFFSRNGFDDELIREAETSGRIRLVSPSDLF